MSELLDIKLIIDQDWPKLTVYIKNKERNEDVEALIAAVQAFSDRKIPLIPAYFRESLVMLPQRQIIRLYIHNRKLMVQTAERLYEVKKPLREVEELLDQSRFVRISQSETINLRRVKSFDFSTVGTIGVELENGETTWVARRRVKDVKEALARGDHNEHQK